MGRQRVDATLGALARRRVDLSSAHFGLAFQQSETPDDTAAVRGFRFAISAPKRQLKRAVDRNALKRVAREAWRLAAWPETGRPQVAMLKLRRSEPDWKTMGRPSLKKVWRAEIDELVVRLIRRLSARDPALRETPAPAGPSGHSGALSASRSQ